jgi:hypothetical protein
MVTHRLSVLAFLALPLAFVAGCDKVPLLAPTGSVISLFAVTTSVSLNSQVDIIAVVIENGAAAATGSGTGGTRTGAGTPVQNGTLISFTTTIGRIEPSEARTHNGQVTVKLITAGTSGLATITAFSGGASTKLIPDIKVGTAAAKTVSVTTTPQTLGVSGGTTQVVATVADDGGSPIGGVPVTFSTEKGSISPSTVVTDSSGVATATLTTTATTKVTAAVGALTGTSTVTVNARGLSTFTVQPTATTAGTPVTFTVTPTSGANLSNVRVDFGDGNSRNLGAISAAQTVVYAYSSSGNFTATATAQDGTGDSGSLSTTVIVGSLPVTLSASPATPGVNAPVTFTVGGLGTAQIDHFTWILDDGTGPFTTTSPQLAHSFTSVGIKNVQVDVFGVGGGKIGSTRLTLEVR